MVNRFGAFAAALFFLASCAAVFFARQWQRERFRNWIDQNEVTGWARYAASHQARVDFQAGTRRLYELFETDDPYTQQTELRQEDEFEIVTWIVFPILGTLHTKSAEAYVEEYNDTMRRLQANPDELNDEARAAHPFENTTEPAAPTDEAKPRH